MTQPRIAPGRRADVGVVNWLVCRVLARAARVPDVHLFSTLAHHRGLFRGWLAFASQLMPGGHLSRQETELAILRVAHLRGCDYEAAHHRRLGAKVGIDAAMRARLERGPTATGWSPRHRVLLAAVDALVQTRTLDDATWDAARAHLDDRELIELCLLVGHYEMLATTIAALRIAPDTFAVE